MPDCFSADNVTAVATVGAVVVALFLPTVALPWLHEKRWAPRLELHYADTAPFRRQGQPSEDGSVSQEIWLRARVRNTGPKAAEGVVVSIQSIVAKSGGDPTRGALADDFDPVRCFWSGRKNAAPITLGRRETKLVDLAKLQRIGGEGYMLFVTSEAKPKGQGNDYVKGTYEIAVAVHSANAMPKEYRWHVTLENEIQRTHAVLGGP